MPLVRQDNPAAGLDTVGFGGKQQLEAGSSDLVTCHCSSLVIVVNKGRICRQEEEEEEGEETMMVYPEVSKTFIPRTGVKNRWSF